MDRALGRSKVTHRVVRPSEILKAQYSEGDVGKAAWSRSRAVAFLNLNRCRRRGNRDAQQEMSSLTVPMGQALRELDPGSFRSLRLGLGARALQTSIVGYVVLLRTEKQPFLG